MKVTFPSTQPAGFHAESSLKALNYVSLDNPSLRGETYIGKGAVLFKFSNVRDPISVTLQLTKLGGVEDLADADLRLNAKSPPRFVLFENFPTDYRNAKCLYELWLLNQDSRNQASSVADVQILYKAP